MVKFTFATEKEGFDNHIEKSIRGYRDLWTDILKLSEYFVEDGTVVIDIGCSTGRLLKAMREQNERFAPECNYLGIEVEEDFFDDLSNNERLSFDHVDIRDFSWGEVENRCSLIISMFTLQFIPKRDRQLILSSINKGLAKGGALIFSEKILSETAQIEEMMTFCFYDWKKNHFSPEQILEKEVQLRHMMKPLSLPELMAMLKEAGFRDIQTFWQNFNFVGIIALKS